MEDMWKGVFTPSLWWTFSLHDIKLRFRRSVLGPFWLTLGLVIMISTLAFINSRLFGQDIATTIPSITIGLVFWTLFTTILNEGAVSFITYETYIKNLSLPLSAHFYRTVARNLIIWMHHMLIYVAVFYLSQKGPWYHYLLFVPGFLLFFLNCLWSGMLVAIISARYRDIPQMLASLLQILFFITPVFWTLNSFKVRPRFVEYNPLHHLLAIVRAPLMGEAPEMNSWIIILGITVFGIAITTLLYRKVYYRIPYWL